MTPICMSWKGKYSEAEYRDCQGFATNHHNYFFDGLMRGINEEVTISDRGTMTVNVWCFKLRI